MKMNWRCAALTLLVAPICAAQQNTAVSSGPCSLIVQDSKERVMFTCTTPTPIEAETVQKIKTLLNTIVQRQQSDAQNTNHKLDEITDLLAGTRSDVHSIAQSLSEGGTQGFGDAHALGKKITEQAEQLRLGYKELTDTIAKLGGQPNWREQANIASIQFYFRFRECCRTYIIEMHDAAIHKLGSSVADPTGEDAFKEIMSLEHNGVIHYTDVTVGMMNFGLFIPYFERLGMLLEQTPETH